MEHKDLELPPRTGSLKHSYSTPSMLSALKGHNTFHPLAEIKIDPTLHPGLGTTEQELKKRKEQQQIEHQIKRQKMPWYGKAWDSVTSGVSWALNYYPEISYPKRFIQTSFAVFDAYGAYLGSSAIITLIGSAAGVAGTAGLWWAATLPGGVFGVVAFKLTLKTIGNHFRTEGIYSERMDAMSDALLSGLRNIEEATALVATLKNEVDQTLPSTKKFCAETEARLMAALETKLETKLATSVKEQIRVALEKHTLFAPASSASSQTMHPAATPANTLSPKPGTPSTS